MKFATAPLALALVATSHIGSADAALTGPEFMGFNWQLSDGTAKILPDYISVDGTYETDWDGISGPFAVTSQTFQRPLKVSVDMRVDPEAGLTSCVVMSVFPSDECIEAAGNDKKNARNLCGYAVSIGTGGNRFSGWGAEFNSETPYGKLVNMGTWHKVTIELLESGTTKQYFLDGVYQHELPDATSWKYMESNPDEGHIAFYSCSDAQYKNLVVEYTNLALGANGAVATQSSTLSQAGHPPNDASWAIDGNTYGGQHSTTITDHLDPSPWWRVDLLGGNDVDLHRVRD